MVGFKANTFPCRKTKYNIQWLCVHLKLDKADLSHDSLSLPSCIVRHLSLPCEINVEIHEFTTVVQKKVSRLVDMHTEKKHVPFHAITLSALPDLV